MPHSGGRVGRGIYFASECSKSAGYGETIISLHYLLHSVILQFDVLVTTLVSCS